MAYGGGTWLFQNKVLPGTYINFVSLARAIVALADRGYVAMPLELDWGVDGEVFTVEATEPDTVVLIMSGKPLHEPIVAYGPFVMNTKQEIMQAFDDLNHGKFGYLED
jgi:hypothetical protein